MTNQVDYQEQVDKYAKKLAEAFIEKERAFIDYDQALNRLTATRNRYQVVEHDYKYWARKLIEQENDV